MALELEHGVLRVEADLDGVVLLQEHRFEQVGRFLGQDERCADLVFGLGLVFHEFVRVGSHERQCPGCEVDVDAVHHGAQLVVGRGEDGLVDAVHEHVHIQPELLLLGAQLRHGGIAHGAGAGDRERTALPVDRYLPVLVVDVDGQRQLGKLLQRVEHQFGGSRDGALAFHTVDRDRAYERRFEVGSGDLQLVAIELHEEVIQDGQRVFIADNLAGCSQERKQGRA